jgi:hypothetical protein
MEMDRRAMKGEGFTVETHGRASLARISRETHGRASLLVALLFLFAACEKDLPGTSGGKVAIIFSLGSSEAEAPRSFSLREPERSEVEIANEENYFLSATLAPDEEGLRAVTTSALIENQKVHLEAYTHSDGSFAGAADYHANAAGQLVLDDPDSPLEVDPAEGPFDFAAYSYYKSTAAISTTSIDPRTDDLIWGHIENQTITETEAGRTVSFNLKHKFVKVRVKISVGKIDGATITDIGTVTIENQSTVDLTVQDGSLSNYTNVGALDVSSSLDTDDDVTYLSDYYVFHPSPTKVNISSIEVTVSGAPTTYNNLFATFTQGLTEAGNYTLAVDLEKFGFSGSNIYWDGERLTFDKTASNPSNPGLSSRYYQGVFFSWGSLVGVAPIGGSDPTFYIPPENGVEEWEVKAMSASGLSVSTSYGSSPPYTVPGGNDAIYLYNHEDFSNYRGDICSYLTNGSWRMPTNSEFGSAWDYSWVNGSSATMNLEGTATITAGRMRDYVFFPVAGFYRFFQGIYPQLLGVNGIYWSGSSNGVIYGYGINFNDSFVDGTYDHTDSESSTYFSFPYIVANSVRCHKN